jgi:hypothetical protein
MGNGPRFAICDSRVTRDNRRAVEEFARLATTSSQRQLKPNEAKRFARLQVQLMRTKVVVPLTKKVVKEQARSIYHALPWWKKATLHVRYWLHRVRVRFATMRLNRGGGYPATHREVAIPDAPPPKSS